MQQERKWIYTLILAICVIVCIILIGKMVLYTDIPQHDPHTVVRRAGDGQAEETREISLDSGALLNLLNRQLPADCPLDDLSLGITADGTLTLSATVSRDELQQVADLPAATAVLLPDACTLSASVSIGWHAEDHALILEPTALSINGLALPSAFLQPMTSLLEQAIDDGLRAQGITFCSMRAEAGRLIIGI